MPEISRFYGIVIRMYYRKQAVLGTKAFGARRGERESSPAPALQGNLTGLDHTL